MGVLAGPGLITFTRTSGASRSPSRWTASAASYQFVLLPFVTIALASVLDFGSLASGTIMIALGAVLLWEQAGPLLAFFA